MTHYLNLLGFLFFLNIAACSIFAQSLGTQEVFTALLPEGAIIWEVGSNTPVKIPRAILVEVYPEADARGFQYLKTKDKNKKYRARLTDLVHIDQVSDLKERPELYQEYRPLASHRSDLWEKLYGSVQIQLHTQNYGGEIIQSFNSAYSEASGQGLRFSGLHYFGWGQAFMAGVNFNYEQASYEQAGQKLLDYKSFSLGPSFDYRFFAPEDINFHLALHGQFAFFSRYDPLETLVASEEDQNNQTGSVRTALEMSFAVHFPWRTDETILGMNIRRQWPGLTDLSSYGEPFRPEDTIGIFVAHRFGEVWSVH